MAAATRPEHGRHLMSLVHHVTALGSGRTTMELNVRQRLIVQKLGLAGASSMAALAQGLGFSPSTLTGLADRLEELGYLRRRPHPTDRRATCLALTDKGRRVFAQEVEFYRSLLQGILAALPAAERRPVLQSIEQIAAGGGDSAAA